jgi:hypothetical protein
MKRLLTLTAALALAAGAAQAQSLLDPANRGKSPSDPAQNATEMECKWEAMQARALQQSSSLPPVAIRWRVHKASGECILTYFAEHACPNGEHGMGLTLSNTNITPGHDLR